MTHVPLDRRAFLCRAAAGAASLAALAATAPALCGEPAGGNASRSDAAPFMDFREHATPYAGPGREREEPANLSEVALGYFGPTDPADREGGDVWRGVQLAVDEVNAGGGCRGKPLRLYSAWSDNPWKAGAGLLARLVHQKRVWALLGGIDGPSAHLAEQVVAKARLPLVCPTSSDRTANVANVSWMFSVLPGDHLQAPALAEALAARAASRGFSVIASEKHDSRLFLAELQRVFVARKISPRFLHVVASGAEQAADVAGRVARAAVDAALVLANADDSARWVVALRRAGFAGTLVGGHKFGRRRFVEAAGDAAEGALFPRLYESAPAGNAFEDAFRRRWAARADYCAAFAYDSVMLLTAAIRSAGLNRARIGDAIRAIAPWKGVTGVVAWDTLGSNTAPVHLGQVRRSVFTRADAT